MPARSGAEQPRGDETAGWAGGRRPPGGTVLDGKSKETWGVFQGYAIPLPMFMGCMGVLSGLSNHPVDSMGF